MKRSLASAVIVFLSVVSCGIALHRASVAYEQGYHAAEQPAWDHGWEKGYQVGVTQATQLAKERGVEALQELCGEVNGYRGPK